MHNWLALVLFSLFAAVFVVICVLYGSTLILDEQGLSLRFFGLPLRAMRWSEIAEVGVVGLKVFNNNDAKRTGTRYIYFSPRPLDKDARFRLALEWPPRDMLYLCYSKERLQAGTVAAKRGDRNVQCRGCFFLNIRCLRPPEPAAFFFVHSPKSAPSICATLQSFPKTPDSAPAAVDSPLFICYFI